MPDGAHRKVKLNVRVTPSKKKEWQDALDDDETLSSLVRRAVDREVNDEYVPTQAIDDFAVTAGDGDADLSPVLDQLENLRQSLTSVEHKVDTMSAPQAGEISDRDIEDLAMDLLPRLPTYPNDIPDRVLREMDGMGGREPQEYISYIVEASRADPQLSIDGRAQRFSTEMKEHTYLVREALCYLENETTENVHSGLVSGKRHWMRL
ncbi:hypothetical protein [Halorubrum vacuolatum]|uniref:Uncharacterized protein n=1 Tax=Halorubrum vacuolatum TaxID=63740 RepID=A0A238WNG1_HALVU|nr:hypothetical protein [Halorubrum vacuolatum]SNR48086.1 hypothetical protein SAMN06264855_10911 [Halorubrum vacuolatum]